MWCFCGQFVVKSVVNVDTGCTLFSGLKLRHEFSTIFPTGLKRVNPQGLPMRRQPALYLSERLHPDVVASAAALFGSADQEGLPQPCCIRRGHIGAAVAYHHALGQRDAKLPGSAAQHSSPGLPVLVLASVLAHAVLGMERAVVHGIELHAFGKQLGPYELHEGLEVRLRIVATGDPRLVRHHNEPVAERRRSPAQREDAIHKTDLLGPMQIPDLNVDYAVAIQKEGSLSHKGLSPGYPLGEEGADKV